jgi:hypothetical protein
MYDTISKFFHERKHLANAEEDIWRIGLDSPAMEVNNAAEPSHQSQSIGILFSRIVPG